MPNIHSFRSIEYETNKKKKFYNIGDGPELLSPIHTSTLLHPILQNESEWPCWIFTFLKKFTKENFIFSLPLPWKLSNIYKAISNF